MELIQEISRKFVVFRPSVFYRFKYIINCFSMVIAIFFIFAEICGFNFTADFKFEATVSRSY